MHASASVIGLHIPSQHGVLSETISGMQRPAHKLTKRQFNGMLHYILGEVIALND